MANNWGAIVALREKRKLIGSFVFERTMSIENAAESAKSKIKGDEQADREAKALMDDVMSNAKAISDFLQEFP